MLANLDHSGLDLQLDGQSRDGEFNQVSWAIQVCLSAVAAIQREREEEGGVQGVGQLGLPERLSGRS